MAFLAVDKNGKEFIYNSKPIRYDEYFDEDHFGEGCVHVYLPKGSIKKLIGYELTWDDDPVELKEI